MRHGRLALTTLALFTVLAAAPPAPAQVPEAVRDHEPIVLKGLQLGDWAVPANQTLKLPLTDLACYQVEPQGGDPTEEGADALTNSFNGENCPHSNYVKPEVDTAGLQPAGTPVEKLVGFAWDAKKSRFKQIPFQ